MLIENLLRLVRPLIRFALRRGVTVQQFQEVVKRGFVEGAMEDLGPTTKRPNVSRISAYTGIDRKEVARILSAPAIPNPEPSLAARVLALWEGDPEFKEKSGVPKVLSYRGSESEFKSLVAKVSSHLNHATVLYELCRMNAVEKSSEGARLIRPSVDAGTTDSKAFDLLARDMASLIGNFEINLSVPNETRNLHLRTEYDNIPEHFLSEIKEFVLDEGRLFHRTMRERLSRYDADINPAPSTPASSKRLRVSVTAFFNSEEIG